MDRAASRLKDALVWDMLDRGYVEDDMRKFLGGNYLRLACAFWG